MILKAVREMRIYEKEKKYYLFLNLDMDIQNLWQKGLWRKLI